MRYIFLILILIISNLAELSAQESTSTISAKIITRGRIVDGDTLPHVHIQEIRCYGKMRRKTKREIARYNKLVRNVKKTLPYARIAAARITIINDSLSHISDPKARKKYLDEQEKKLFAEFEQPLRHLTISQGRVLIKLIDRETGDTSYELIRSMRGRFSAFLWQGVARLFGSNLKAEYEAKGEDKEIERIVWMIDDGIIQ
ncbi:MAG: DUF4294 domain-containing protein [Bacteroidales bacterium]|nr:DUF4294 domain-containing protein [Bacteroidales bacterium]MBP5420733.1 DUF4294 domain-containing protein [Bacteroidales bacterium]MCR5697572.1 DUF4294 domain-containing protein [Marinilabiliaceae bacterium]